MGARQSCSGGQGGQAGQTHTAQRNGFGWTGVIEIAARALAVAFLLGLLSTLGACGDARGQGPVACAGAASGCGGETGSNGLPSDWRPSAVSAAREAIARCASSRSLQPDGCPQRVQPQSSADLVDVRWVELTDPARGAIAIEGSTDSTGAAAPGVVSVYGRYLMEVTYTTTSAQGVPYRDVSGGLFSAVMTWDGHAYQNIHVSGGSSVVTAPGTAVPPATRPDTATDDAALSAVRTAFSACVTRPMPLAAVAAWVQNGPPVANCPMWMPALDVNTTEAHWTLDGDPTTGALVTFDTDRGVTTVTGGFDITLHSTVSIPGDPGYGATGPHTTREVHGYVATLVPEGQGLTVVRIAPAS